MREWASSVQGDVVWVDTGERPTSLNEILQVVSDVFPAARGRDSDGVRTGGDSSENSEVLLDRLRMGGSGRVFVVIDGLADPHGDLIRDILAVGQQLSGSGLQFVVSSRSSAALAAAKHQGCAVLDAHDLRLREDEALSLAVSLGVGSDADRLLAESGGHIAAFCILSETKGLWDRSGAAVAEHSTSIWIRRCIEGVLSKREMQVFCWLSVIGHGRSERLPIPLRESQDVLRRVAESMPLVALSRSAEGYDFRIHELLAAAMRERADSLLAGGGDLCARSAATHLVREARYLDATSVAIEHLAERERIDWADSCCDCYIGGAAFVELDRLATSLETGLMMGKPGLLCAWAEALTELGRFEDAQGISSAAACLFEHESSRGQYVRARLVLLSCHKGLARYVEAGNVARELVPLMPRMPPELRVRVAVECAGVFCATGRFEDAEALLDTLPSQLELADPRVRRQSASIRAVLPGLSDGDYRKLADTAGAYSTAASEGCLSDSHALAINYAIALLEMGRTGELASVLEAESIESDYYLGPALSLRGLALHARGAESSKPCLDAGLKICTREDSASDLAIAFTYHSAMERASGRLLESLRFAEGAARRCSEVDFFGFRNLATVEVAASLLSLGDSSAARRWIATLDGRDGMRRNRYHALRAAMVLAECDRCEGDFALGVARLKPHADHIVSESSNWQMAMYVRAFPHLLGMLALAAEVDELPVHMLRMVLPEFAERCLKASQDELDPTTWERLGRRVLGDVEFDQLAGRGGKPVCRVRLFGSLDVTVGDRRIAERDWAKRKSRLLFAMLVTARGHDVPRDQILEYLWPEMDEDRARSNFYVVWSKMKLALGTDDDSATSPFVESARGRCRIKTEAVRSDVDEFEEALQEARASEANGDSASAIGAYQRAASVYRGDLLPGDIYDDWFSTMRDRLRNDCVDGLLRLCDLLCDSGDPDDAVVFARKAVQVDPLREDAFQTLLRCQIAAGQRSGAIDTFFRCKNTLSEELGLDPSSDTLALYERVLAMEERAAFSVFNLTAEKSEMV